jgi:hypothetical protein
MPLVELTCTVCDQDYTAMKSKKPRKYCPKCQKEAAQESLRRHRAQARSNQWVSKTNCAHCGRKPIKGKYCKQDHKDCSEEYARRIAENPGGLWND